MKPPFSQEDLRKFLTYDEETGVLRWGDFLPSNRRPGTIAGGLNTEGYLRLQVQGKTYGAHRIAWYYVHGEWPAEIDHINGVKTDNRLSNLRAADRFLNTQNAVRRHKTTHPGARFNKKTGKWKAELKVRGTVLQLGIFTTPEQASAAYLAAKRAHHAPYATGIGKDISL
jgi:hypothetical protein